MKIKSFPIFFVSILLLGLAILFLVHYRLLEAKGYHPADYRLATSYILNAIMALIVFFAIFLFRAKHRDLLGFFFLGGSLVKFTLFFIFLYPAYNQDGALERLEFVAFFVPYAFAQVLETFFLVKLLNTV
ncbi:hypothetical protein [Flagellimonas crocea]|uniref:hypothetical protein n=1 Tax=Flagellimonas crocea TaxID=3067311 RepID=UPI00296F31EB|nr:hypothetical protein [Muricauda sp. DH64]